MPSVDPEFSWGTAPGQKPIVIEPLCECPPEVASGFLGTMMRPIHSAVVTVFNGCPIAVSVALLRIIAALVNPANVEEHSRANSKRAALAVAGAMEIFAKGIRE